MSGAAVARRTTRWIMRAKCKCGHIFEVPAGLEGKVSRCPGCGHKIRLPASRRKESPPPLPPQFGGPDEDGELDLGWDDLEPDQERAAPDAPTQEPTPDTPKGDDEMAFDWGNEFSLGEEDEASPPEPAEPPASEEAATSLDLDGEFELDESESTVDDETAAQGLDEPQAEEGADLAFDSTEFKLDKVPEEQPIALSGDQIIAQRKPGEEPVAPAAVGPVTAPEGTPKPCPKCGRIVMEEVAVCPECGTLLSAGEAESARPIGGHVRRARGTEPTPTNIFTLMLACVKRPSMVGDIGAGGISGGNMLAQIGGAFVVLTLITAALESLNRGAGVDWSPIALLLRLGLRFVALFATVLAMWLVASMVSKGVTFMGILTGLTFVEVLGGVVAIAGLTIALVAALGGIVGAPLAAGALLASAVLMFIFRLYFIMGVFDMGCFGAVILSIVASFIAGGIQVYVGALLFKVFGLNIVKAVAGG